MGIEGLSKLIKPVREVKLQEFKGKRFAIDAMVELNRAFKGPVVLTNGDGEKTHHIRSLLSLVLKLQSYGIEQIWVFDHDISNDSDPNEHFKYKRATIEKRKAIKNKNKERLWIAQQKLIELKEKVSSLSDEKKSEYDKLTGDLETDDVNKEISIIQKRVDAPYRKEIDDLKYILNTLGVEWVEAPCTFEGEATAADLVKTNIADYVLTPDLDALLYGAPNVIKRVGKGKDVKFLLYNLDHVIENLEIGYEDLIKIGLCLGTDATPLGIKGIGVGTVLKKFENATDWNVAPYPELIGMFGRTYDVARLKFNNIKSISFTDIQQKELIAWLVKVQNFDRDRTVKQFSNALSQIKVGNIINKTPVIEIKWDSIAN